MVRTTTHSSFNRAVLLVCNNPSTYSIVERIAKFNDLQMQVAHSISAALFFLEHRSIDYSLIVINELLDEPGTKSFISTVCRRWPDHHVAVLSAFGATGNAGDLQKGLGSLRKISMPASEKALCRLMAEVKEEHSTDLVPLRRVVESRLAILQSCIGKVLFDTLNEEISCSFARDYLTLCERVWRQSGRYSNDIYAQDSEQFQVYLKRQIYISIKRACSKKEMFNDDARCSLSQLLCQFNIKMDNKSERYMKGCKSVMIAMLALLQDYCDLLGEDISDMLSVGEQSITCCLGGRFTYNDLFNPLLSSVEKGAELVCLKLELLFLARISGLAIEINFQEAYSLTIVC